VRCLGLSLTLPPPRIRAGGKTYFLDLKKTKQESSYLQIAESRKDKNNQFLRSSINVFPEAIDEFLEALNRLAKLV
jgi:Protein of unknown function (DUF3276)